MRIISHLPADHFRVGDLRLPPQRSEHAGRGPQVQVGQRGVPAHSGSLSDSGGYVIFFNTKKDERHRAEMHVKNQPIKICQQL